MSPFDLVTAIEDADVRARRGRRRIILEFTTPSILGHRGKYLGDDESGPRFGYTRRQCLLMRDDVLRAADHDLRAGSQE